LLSWAKVGKDRKGRSKATRSEGDDLEGLRVLLARSCAMGGEDVVGEVKGVEEVGMRFACRGARSRGDRRSEIEVDPKPVAFAMICPTLLLRPLKKAARLDIYVERRHILERRLDLFDLVLTFCINSTRGRGAQATSI